ncbi:hypothetical protein MSG28_014728 [Choristoneura fumiferana]|uniref:Uncharacterized protein n=1 Tax=Choristoneura fumiferana TaxID=7141 RepID=A0ACC0JSY7_CHOFU|nr:hypothetical protein MSG28_014728 [Choristoneura fumiferana]
MMDFDEIVVKESPGLCRCCLSEGCYKDLGSEYSWMSETEIYADMLLECFDISISQHPSGPNGSNRLICEVCITRLRDACNFKKQVLESEKRFVDMVGRGEFRPKEDLLKNEDYGEPSVSEDITVSALAVKGKRGRPKKSSTAVKPEKKAKVPKLEEKPTKSKAVAKGMKWPETASVVLTNKSLLTATNRNRLMKANAITVLESSTVVPFRWHSQSYSCFFCHKNFQNINILKKHTWDEHQKANIKAAVSYLRRDEKVKVFFSVIDCRLCNADFNDINSLIGHLRSAHDKKFTELNGCFGVLPYRFDGDTYSFKCAVCNEEFKYFTKLNEHMNIHYGDYMCAVCGKGFLSQSRLRSHAQNHGSGFRCSLCPETFDSLTIKYKHESKVHNKKKVCKCFYCDETFPDYIRRKTHHRTVHNINVPCSNCPICHKAFELPSKMLTHLKEVHIREKNYSCTICDQKFFSKTKVQKHMVKHFGERVHQCEVCKKSYARKQTLRDHMRIHNNDKRFVCALCSQAFVQNSSLKQHMRVHHPEAVNVKPRKYKGCESSSMRRRRNLQILFNSTTIIPFKWRGKYLCFYCSKDIAEYSALRKHTKSHGDCSTRDHSLKVLKGGQNMEIKIDVSDISCEICSEPFPTYDDIVTHLFIKHKLEYDKGVDMAIEEYRLVDLSCLACEEKFAYFGYLVSHVNNSHPKNCLICDKCEQKFNKKRDLFSHMKNYHREEIKHQSIGGLGATERRRKNLVILFNNTTVIPFKSGSQFGCFYCGEKYRDYKEFVKHTKSHGPCNVKHKSLVTQKYGSSIEVKLDISNVTCELCDEPFNSLDEIIPHLIAKHGLHYDQDVPMCLSSYRLVDLKCTECGKSFEYFRNLVMHVRKNHMEKLVPCEQCDKSFNKKSDLAAHCRIYHRRAGFQCVKCELCFRKNSLLRLHLMNTHGASESKCARILSRLKSRRNSYLRLDAEDLAAFEDIDDCEIETQRRRLRERNAIAKRNRENIACILNMTTAIPFKYYQNRFTCFHCSKDFNEHEDVRTHTLLEHPFYDLERKCPKSLKGVNMIYRTKRPAN